MGYKEMLEGIEWVLATRSSYRVARSLNINNRTINRYQNGETPIENMTLGTAKKIYNYYLKEMDGMNQMVREMVKDGEVNLLEMDNRLEAEFGGNSIFEYDSTYWHDIKEGNKAAHTYQSMNVWFEIVEDHGLTKETIVKVLEVEEV